MLAYPTEHQKGKFIAIFWSIFNLGGVVGAAVSLGQNFESTVRRLPYLPCARCGDATLVRLNRKLTRFHLLRRPILVSI